MDDNTNLQTTIAELERELLDCEQTTHTDGSNFTVQTKNGTRYLNSVRELYYNLLTTGISPEKIEGTVRMVLNKLCPSLDTSSLKLPKKTCSNYMRMAEMPTISDSHKATKLTETNQGHINSDGTTLSMRKLIGSAVSGTVLGVNEVSDGSSETMIKELDRQLARLREMASELDIPNANSINWTLIVSSTSDGASTQTKFNRLLEELRVRDEHLYGPVNNSLKEVVANKCGMHLGVNLRKAQNAGILEYDKSAMEDDYEMTMEDSADQVTENKKREHIPIDSFVHAFCKLLGQVGTPEYGQGISFRDYIMNQYEKSKCTGDDTRTEYLQKVLKTNLERQVGSRYFVTAHNSSRIYFLYPAAVEFLNHLGKTKSLNRLEQYVLAKLQDPVMLKTVKVDGLFFYHVYSDLTTLVKSQKLKKSVFDMNVHYLELHNFLQEVKQHPERLYDRGTPVFISEKKLHTDKKLNQRETKAYIYDKLFTIEDTDKELVFPRIKAAAEHMHTKLSEYKKDQLPGGKYWNPTEEVKKILEQLQPNNDICESILGLNDWLSSQTPNLCQKTKSTLVEVKKNKTMTWLDTLTEERRDAIINMAQEKRKEVQKSAQDEEDLLRKQRIKKMEIEAKKAKEKEERRLSELEKLSTIPLIKTVPELQSELEKIEADRSQTIPAKEKNKLELLKNQVRIRNKVLGKSTKITFSVAGKQKTFEELMEEVTTMIEGECTSARKRQTTSTVNSRAKKQKQLATQYLSDPEALIGKDIVQRFTNEDTNEEELWDGRVTAYNSQQKTHTVTYSGDQEQYEYDLTIDITNGDLWVLV